MKSVVVLLAFVIGCSGLAFFIHKWFPSQEWYEGKTPPIFHLCFEKSLIGNGFEIFSIGIENEGRLHDAINIGMDSCAGHKAGVVLVLVINRRITKETPL